MRRRAVELEPLGSPWADMALWMLAIARQVLGDAAGADEALEEAVAAAEAAGHRALHACLLGHRALLAIDRNDWVLGRVLMAEADALGVSGLVEGYLRPCPVASRRSASPSMRARRDGSPAARARRDAAPDPHVDRPGTRGAVPAGPGARSPRGQRRGGCEHAAVPGERGDPAAPGPGRPAGRGGPPACGEPRSRVRPGCLDAHHRRAAGARDAAVLPLVQGDRPAPGRHREHHQDPRDVDLRQARGHQPERGGGASGGRGSAGGIRAAGAGSLPVPVDAGARER